MAVKDPLARKVMISYPKGTVTLSIGLYNYLFGEEIKLQWQKPWDFTDAVTGRKRMKYGRRQRSAAAGGRVITLSLNDGGNYNVRITGEDNDFIDFILSKVSNGVVLRAWTRRGTLYGPQFPAALATL